MSYASLLYISVVENLVLSYINLRGKKADKNPFLIRSGLNLIFLNYDPWYNKTLPKLS